MQERSRLTDRLKSRRHLSTPERCGLLKAMRCRLKRGEAEGDGEGDLPGQMGRAIAGAEGGRSDQDKAALLESRSTGRGGEVAMQGREATDDPGICDGKGEMAMGPGGVMRGTSTSAS